MNEIRPLFNTQSQSVDVCPSVVKDIPLSKESKQAEDAIATEVKAAGAQEVVEAANATPSLNNPEADKTEETKPVSSDIETMYMKEVNKDSSDDNNATALNASNAAKISTKPKVMPKWKWAF